MHKRALPLAVLLHKIKVKRLDAASYPKKKNKKKELHERSACVGKCMHIYTINTTAFVSQVVHLKATEDIFDISMNMHYSISIILSDNKPDYHPTYNLTTYQIHNWICIEISVLCERTESDMRAIKHISI